MAIAKAPLPTGMGSKAQYPMRFRRG